MFMFVKRSLDIIFPLAFLTLLAPWLFFAIALLIKLDSRGPVFFIQKRGGLKKNKFYLYKFRTLKESVETRKKHDLKESGANSCHTTRASQILRTTGLDELPQFFNILKGDMSLVGPRPHTVAMDTELSKIVPRYYERLTVKPGLTGWAQVNGSRGPVVDARVMGKRLAYDLWYVEHQSFWFDVKIIGMTIRLLMTDILISWRQ